MNVKKCYQSCHQCGKCCYCSIGPIIFPSDAKKISEYLNIHPMDFLKKYCKKSYINTIGGKLYIYYFKIIQGHCIFLMHNNLCEIYNIRPYQCINAPYNFLSNSECWNHMPCLDMDKLKKSNSEKLDLKIFSEIINDGYDILK